MTKLTLSINENTVQKAKKIAQANGTSISAMFSQFVLSMSAAPGKSAKIGPLTRKLSGIVKLPRGKGYKDLLTDALMDKHGMRK